MEHRNLAPIVIFCFKRPEHLDRLLTSLKTCPEFSASQYYVFSDGPRSERDAAQVDLTRKVVANHQLPNLQMFPSEKNKGLATSVIDGLSLVFSKHDRAIVLEDDLVLSPYFLNYMNSALEFYRDIPQVATVAGYGFPTDTPLPDLYFYRIASSWGWATWKRAWGDFEPDATKLIAPMRKSFLLRRKFNVGGKAAFYQMLRLQHEGKISSWAVRWAASVFLKGKLNLHAGGSGSYVQNEGHDGTGTHCADVDSFKTRLRMTPPGPFPTVIAEEPHVIRAIGRYYRTFMPTRLDQRIKRKLLLFFQLMPQKRLSRG